LTSLRGATDAVVFWSALKDAVTHRYNQARDAVEAEMRSAGSEKQRARDLDGVKSGSVTLGEGRYVGVVEDAKALIEWLRINYPEQVQTIETSMVRPAYLSVLLDLAARNAADIDGPGPVPVDGDTGAVIPGVRAKWVEGTVRVVAEHAAKTRAASLLLAAMDDHAPDSVWAAAPPPGLVQALADPDDAEEAGYDGPPLVYGEGRQELEEGSL
jgi:hypothetical protein